MSNPIKNTVGYDDILQPKHLDALKWQKDDFNPRIVQHYLNHLREAYNRLTVCAEAVLHNDKLGYCAEYLHDCATTMSEIESTLEIENGMFGDYFVEFWQNGHKPAFASRYQVALDDAVKTLFGLNRLWNYLKTVDEAIYENKGEHISKVLTDVIKAADETFFAFDDILTQRTLFFHQCQGKQKVA